MLKSTRATIVVLAILLLAVQAMAQHAPKGRWWRSPEVVSALNLTDSEIQQLEQSYEQSRRQMIGLKSKVEQEQFELSNLIEQRDFNEVAIRTQNRKLEEARAELAEARFAFVIEVRKVIGAQRLQQLLDLKSDKR